MNIAYIINLFNSYVWVYILTFNNDQDGEEVYHLGYNRITDWFIGHSYLTEEKVRWIE